MKDLFAKSIIWFVTFALGITAVGIVSLFSVKPDHLKSKVSGNFPGRSNNSAKSRIVGIGSGRAGPEKTNPIPFHAVDALTCTDPNILPVWRLIKNDPEFTYLPNDGSFQWKDCAEMFEVFFFDLDSTGPNEILLRGSVGDTCGTKRNCQLFVFQKVGGKYQKILFTTDFSELTPRTRFGLQIQSTKTLGFNDILVTSYINIGDTGHTKFAWNGNRYVIRKALVYRRSVPEIGQVHEIISRKEYDKRNTR